MNRFESQVSTPDGQSLFYQTWEHPQPRARVLIVHGLGEHSGKYHDFVEQNRSLAVTFAGYDQRGHGRSSGPRGCVDHFAQLTQDLDLLIETLGWAKEKLPWGVFGHSMGGLVVLKHALSQPMHSPHFIALSSPYLGLAMAVPAWKVIGAHVLTYLAPKLALDDEIKNSMVSRDPAHWEKMDKDHLHHHQISSRMFLGAQEAIEFVQARADKLKIPLLLQMPYRDEVVSSPASQSFFERVASAGKMLKIYPERKHEIFFDLEREQVFADFQAWIRSQSL